MATPPPAASGASPDPPPFTEYGKMEALARDIDRRPQVWRQWAECLLQEQSTLDPRSRPLTSIMLSSNIARECVHSALQRPLGVDELQGFQTVLKTTLLNTIQPQEGQPDAVDHIQLRLQQLSLFFERCRCKCHELIARFADGGSPSPAEGCDKLQERLADSIATAVAMLRKPNHVTHHSGQGHVAPSSHYSMAGSLPQVGSSPSLANSVSSDAVAGPATAATPQRLRSSDPSTGISPPPRPNTPRGKDSQALRAHLHDGSLVQLLQASRHTASDARHLLTRLDRELQHYQDLKELDARLRHEVSAQLDQLSSVQRDCEGSYAAAVQQVTDFKGCVERERLCRERTVEATAVELQEQEHFLDVAKSEKAALELRLKQLVRAITAGKERLGILRGRMRTLSQSTTPQLEASLADLRRAEAVVEVQELQRRMVHCSHSFLKALSADAANCAVTHLEAEEELVGSSMLCTAQSCNEVLDVQVSVIRRVAAARGELLQYLRGPAFEGTTKGLAADLAEELLRQAAVAEDYYNVLIGLDDACQSEQLRGDVGQNVKDALEKGNELYKRVAQMVDADAIHLQLDASRTVAPQTGALSKGPQRTAVKAVPGSVGVKTALGLPSKLKVRLAKADGKPKSQSSLQGAGSDEDADRRALLWSLPPELRSFLTDYGGGGPVNGSGPVGSGTATPPTLEKAFSSESEV